MSFATCQLLIPCFSILYAGFNRRIPTTNHVSVTWFIVYSNLQSGWWSHVSHQAKDLVTSMLHIAPQRRPTAAQLVKHPWLNSMVPSIQQQVYCIEQNVNTLNSGYNNQSVLVGVTLNQPPSEGKHLKETVAATFRAIAASPQIAHLGPVAMSELARRRFKDKALGRLQQS